jgi:hypothetical protein
VNRRRAQCQRKNEQFPKNVYALSTRRATSVDVGEPVLTGELAELADRWFQRPVGVAAMAATPRPTKRGLSDSVKAPGAMG